MHSSRIVPAKKANTVDFGRERRYKELIARLESIPPLPTAAQSVLTILAKDPRDALELEHAIRHDPSLTSQLLKVANCAAYSPRAPIDTVHRAIVYLGLTEVCNIAFGLSVLGMFKTSNRDFGLDIREFWTHSIATAIIARILAEEMKEDDPEIFFTAGLLHDLGRLAMAQCLSKEWKQIVYTAASEGIPLLRVERSMGLSHSMIGAWLARNWKLPVTYVRAIATHHLPVRHKKATTVGALIQLADHLSHHAGMGVMQPPTVGKKSLIAYLGLGPEMVADLEEQLQEMEEMAESIADMMLLME